ncbi:hypothetical protein MANES_13G059333v8 [Manihot esculenta]|uniref:Uncharacterized protein n=1 Tax=Manihot esculenta TaxID=3983 RepID=A0ACB7GKI7_MANES|nr:hypothetical protein MANES_13G059333v8 [Manihot esculenta]
MKQKVVIRVSLNGEKSRSKALKIAVSVSGVESAALGGGQDKSQIEVVGDVDPVKLTTQLRKSVGHAELLSLLFFPPLFSSALHPSPYHCHHRRRCIRGCRVFPSPHHRCCYCFFYCRNYVAIAGAATAIATHRRCSY